MTDQTASSPQPGPGALASSLLSTLQEEYDSLVRLRGHFDDHILALRKREKDGIDEATYRTNDEVNVLAKLKQQRDRKMRLLGRVLRIDSPSTSLDDVVEQLGARSDTADAASQLQKLRLDIRAEAMRTQKRCRDLEFALEFAVHLGRDLLQALQGVTPTASTKVYTPKGGAVESSGTSTFVNRVG